MTRRQIENNRNIRKSSTSTNASISSGHVGVQNNQNIPPLNINDPSSILNSINNSNFNFSVKKYSDYILESTKPNIRQDTLEGVSFFSQQSITKEWEILRTPWYQNNIQFKPKFRKPCK